MNRKAFVFEGSSWRTKSTPSLAQEYAQWVNDLLAKYPNAKFEYYQNLGSFFWEHEESDWVHLYCLVVVTEP